MGSHKREEGGVGRNARERIEGFPSEQTYLKQMVISNGGTSLRGDV